MSIQFGPEGRRRKIIFLITSNRFLHTNNAARTVLLIKRGASGSVDDEEILTHRANCSQGFLVAVGLELALSSRLFANDLLTVETTERSA